MAASVSPGSADPVDTLAGLAALVRSGGDPQRVLEAVARTVAQTLGVAAVAVHVYRPAWDDYEVVVDGGPDPDDALTVPLTASDGSPLAFLSLDEPSSGAPLAMLSVVTEIAAGVIEHGQVAAEAARHRAAVEHLMRASSELNTSCSRAEMLRTVCEGIRDALGFEMAGVFLDEEGDGRLVPAAAVGFEGVANLGSFTAAAVEAMIIPEFLREGCVLIECATARALAVQAGMPTIYASRNNGRGPRAWDHHWLLVPLRSREGTLLGFVWADDPVDRLLPSVDGLRALRAFANHAVGAIETARQLERLRELAELDPLTGLRNRRGFEADLAARRERQALVICDLDHFKRVNDTLGHPAGDEVLRRFARVLCAGTREGDTAVRLGGEEFALVLAGVGENEALAVAERLRSDVTAEFHDFPMPISVSVGIAEAPPGGDPEQLVRAASRALFAAKRLGRDRCVIHHADTLAMLDALVDERAGEQLAAAVLLAETLDLRDVATARHSETVGRYAEQIGIELGLPPDHVERLRVAGVLHDIGKLGISDVVLLKPGSLNASEWEQIERHPEVGARILEHANLRDVASWVLAHHERVDGAGYPRGLAGDAIPLEGRVLAVADAYEAMTADRPYRRALTHDIARAELRRAAGTQFDPQVVEAFLRALG